GAAAGTLDDLAVAACREPRAERHVAVPAQQRSENPGEHARTSPAEDGSEARLGGSMSEKCGCDGRRTQPQIVVGHSGAVDLDRRSAGEALGRREKAAGEAGALESAHEDSAARAPGSPRRTA